MMRHARAITFIAYGCLLAGLYVGPVGILACALALLLWLRGEGEYREHGRYQARTIVMVVMALLVAALLARTVIGPYLILAVKAWAAWRPLRGAYLLHRHQSPV